MKLRVCLDPGHGGPDPGAVGPNGLEEAQVVLEVCRLVKRKLEAKGHMVWLTRNADAEVELYNRTALCKEERCDVFVSVHCNAGSPEIKGIETVYGNQKSKLLASCVHQAVTEWFPKHRNRGLKLSPSPDYPRKLYVLRNSGCDACLVELEFISNAEQEKQFKEQVIIETYAEAIADGIHDYSIA